MTMHQNLCKKVGLLGRRGRDKKYYFRNELVSAGICCAKYILIIFCALVCQRIR